VAATITAVAPPRRPLSLDAGAALLLSIADGAPAVGAVGEVSLLARRLGVGGRLQLWGSSLRDLDLSRVLKKSVQRIDSGEPSG
jgi:hypothetical protein